MTEQAKIEQVILDFIKGGDNRDIALLQTVLHANFRVANNGYLGTSGVTIITREEYLHNIETGVFGGLPREIHIENMNISGTIAMVKISLASRENNFVSYNSLVLDSNGHWKIIDNLAVVTPTQ